MKGWARRSVAGVLRLGSSRPVALVSAAILGLALVAGGITVIRFGEQSASEADTRLDHYADGMAGDLAALFATASRDLRLARQNATYDAALGGTAQQLAAAARSQVENSITYVADRYHVDEICLIRSTGLETARWNGGRVAAASDLSPDESGNPFF